MKENWKNVLAGHHTFTLVKAIAVIGIVGAGNYVAVRNAEPTIEPIELSVRAQVRSATYGEYFTSELTISRTNMPDAVEIECRAVELAGKKDGRARLNILQAAKTDNKNGTTQVFPDIRYIDVTGQPHITVMTEDLNRGPWVMNMRVDGGLRGRKKAPSDAGVLNQSSVLRKGQLLPGKHTVACEVTDGKGETSVDFATITVISDDIVLEPKIPSTIS